MIKVNMMCGRRNFGPDWVHVDGGDYDHVNSKDVYLQAMFNGSVDLIYCSHGIAYWEKSVMLTLLLGMWYNKMAPGGVLRIATPDFDVLTKLYQTGVPFERIQGPLYGKMPLNSDTIYHKTCYDEKSLTELLTEAGFVNIQRYDHRKTEHPNTGDRADFFDDCSAAYIDGHLISLNIECIKPL